MNARGECQGIIKLTMIKPQSYFGNPKQTRSARSSLLRKSKGIYADLIIVENKYIKVDDAQSAQVEGA